MESNGGIFGRYGEKYIAPGEDSYMTNPNLTVIVPIAPGESDVEFLEEEEISESSEDENSKPVSFSHPHISLQRTETLHIYCCSVLWMVFSSKIVLVRERIKY